MTSCLLLIAFVTIYIGLAGLALSQPRHWTRLLRKPPSSRRVVLTLRMAACGLLGVSLIVALAYDRVEFAAILWTMLLTAGAAAVACTLTWWPGLLRPLARLVARLSSHTIRRP